MRNASDSGSNRFNFHDNHVGLIPFVVKFETYSVITDA